MRFDYIIGNPPFHENDGGHGGSSSPMYHHFVNSAKEMQPRSLCLITPSRWYTGGKHLDRFREKALKDPHYQIIIDYEDARECFPDTIIGGGVNYFVWSPDYDGACEIVNVHGVSRSEEARSLSEFSPVFVRNNDSVHILRKIVAVAAEWMRDTVSSRNPFGIPTNVRGVDSSNSGEDLQLISSRGIGYISKEKVTRNEDWIDKWKVVVGRAISGHAGETDKDGKSKVVSTLKVLEPGQICTDTYIVGSVAVDKQAVDNVQKYLSTKFVRFLLLQTVSSINLTRDNYRFVPVQDFTSSSDIDWSKSLSDIEQQLYKKYCLSDDEIVLIESQIKEMA